MDLVENLVKSGMVKDEVCIRRVISALYFCLFNYWAARWYEIDRKRGKGTFQDRFPFRQFHQYLLGRRLDKEVVLLYMLRTASDHYMLNPTTIDVQNKEILSLIPREKIEVNISIDKLKISIESSRKILKTLNQ